MGSPAGQPGITFDEALTKHVGQFGPGQWRTLGAASVSLLANAAAFFFWVFATVNPITNHHWECTSAIDKACQAVKQQEVPSSAAFCALPAGSTQLVSVLHSHLVHQSHDGPGAPLPLHRAPPSHPRSCGPQQWPQIT